MSATGKTSLTQPPAAPPAAAQPNPTPPEHAAAAPEKPKWRKFVVPVLVLLLAAAIVITLTRDWNAWEGGRIEQVTDDAVVRGDVTPLSTKVAGIVRDVKVTDFQQVHKGDLLVELEDDDYQAQLAQANAAVEAAKAAIENNHRQRELQDSRIARASAGVDQANAQIAAAKAGVDQANAQIAAAKAGEAAVQADVVRTQKERQ